MGPKGTPPDGAAAPGGGALAPPVSVPAAALRTGDSPVSKPSGSWKLGGGDRLGQLFRLKSPPEPGRGGTAGGSWRMGGDGHIWPSQLSGSAAPAFCNEQRQLHPCSPSVACSTLLGLPSNSGMPEKPAKGAGLADSG